MECKETFSDKNRYTRSYPTVLLKDEDGNYNNYSCILFHKVKWSIGNTDISVLEDTWAENIIQMIIDGFWMGEFEIVIYSKNDNEKEECHWLRWKIETFWNGWR